MAGGDTVTLPESAVQDIAVLKVQHTELRRITDDGNQNTQRAIATLSGRVESLVDMMRSISALQAQHEAHRDAVSRAFEEIRATDTALDEHIDEEDTWRKDHEKANAGVEKKMALWQGIAIGISLTIGVATGAAMWGGNLALRGIQDDINALEAMDVTISANEKDTDKRINKLERDAAIDHSR